MKPKNLVLVAAATLSFLVGAANQYVFPGAASTPFDVASLIFFAFFLFWWFRLDTQERGFKRTSGLTLAVVGLAVIALPYYFFKSRGAKGGFVALGCFLLVIVASGVLTLAGQYATYFGLQV
jgi:hypothetical protein